MDPGLGPKSFRSGRRDGAQRNLSGHGVEAQVSGSGLMAGARNLGVDIWLGPGSSKWSWGWALGSGFGARAQGPRSGHEAGPRAPANSLYHNESNV